MKKIALIVILLTLAVSSHPVAAYDLGGVNIHGFISQGYIYSDEYNYLAPNTTHGSFEYNEMGINFSNQLTDKLRVGMQLFSRDLGDTANNMIVLDWAYGDYRLRDWLGIQVGRIRLPMGLYNETRDADMLRVPIVMPQGIYNEFERDNLIALNGLGLHGNVDMKAMGGLDYHLAIGTINSDEASGFGKVTTDELGGLATLNGSIENGNTYNAALRWETPLPGLRFGFTYTNEERIVMPVSTYDYSTGVPVPVELDVIGDGIVQVYSLEFTWGNLVTAAEYMIRDVSGTIGGFDTSKKVETYYLSASYRFNDWFTLGAYYSEFFPDKDDKDGENQILYKIKGWEKDLALTLRFDINAYWVFKLEGHAMDGAARVFMADNTDNNYTEENWYYGVAKTSISF